jgi:hypothetical protein
LKAAYICNWPKQLADLEATLDGDGGDDDDERFTLEMCAKFITGNTLSVRRLTKFHKSREGAVEKLLQRKTSKGSDDYGTFSTNFTFHVSVPHLLPGSPPQGKQPRSCHARLL